MNYKFAILMIAILTAVSCSNRFEDNICVRTPVDSIGFAVTAEQMDIVMSRLTWDTTRYSTAQPWKVCISPHDDYQYVNNIYPELLQNVRSDIVILFGVAHKAASLGLEDKLVFDSYDYWSAPYGDVKVSDLREEITGSLDTGYYTVNDSMHGIEHSLESLIPFLQYFNRNIEIIPVLVPFMSPERMEATGIEFARVLSDIIRKQGLVPGTDISFVITTDAVHYGNEEWGGNDYAFLGCDSAGNSAAVEHEYEIINNCLTGDITAEKLALFSRYTLSESDYHKYIWTWCGRYSVPAGLYTAINTEGFDLPQGKLIDYSTSILNSHIDFSDNGMGTTAIATECHWVGYPAIGY